MQCLILMILSKFEYRPYLSSLSPSVPSYLLLFDSSIPSFHSPPYSPSLLPHCLHCIFSPLFPSPSLLSSLLPPSSLSTISRGPGSERRYRCSASRCEIRITISVRAGSSRRVRDQQVRAECSRVCSVCISIYRLGWKCYD